MMSPRHLAALFAFAAIGCGGDDAGGGFHELTFCNASWGSGEGDRCEAGCEEQPDMTSMESCYAITTGHPYDPSAASPPEFCDHVATVTIDGVAQRGCCKNVDNATRFAECCDAQGSGGTLSFTCPK